LAKNTYYGRIGGEYGVARRGNTISLGLNKNGSMDGYKWFKGLLQMVWRANWKGFEG